VSKGRRGGELLERGDGGIYGLFMEFFKVSECRDALGSGNSSDVSLKQQRTE